MSELWCGFAQWVRATPAHNLVHSGKKRLHSCEKLCEVLGKAPKMLGVLRDENSSLPYTDHILFSPSL